MVKRIGKFFLVGITGFVINNGGLWLLYSQLGIALFFASPLSISMAIVNNYIFHHYYTWKKNRDKRRFTFKQGLWRYFVTASFSAGINYVVLIVLSEIFSVYYLTANVIGILAGSIFNFTLSEKWIFAEIISED